MKKSIVVILLTPLLFGLSWAQDDRAEKVRSEESEEYFKKWLEQDVRYIINDEEKAVFSQLQTPDEKEQFVEQFWFRRDPDPRTPENEFKEEHYRRIAYANEHFTSGDPGWVTDRGRIYIIHGQPDSIETRPMGGTYVRQMYEGGGTTTTFPFEKWRYRYLEGIGDDVELEFVDQSNSGEYKLAVFYWEKDAAMYSAGGGKTLAEEMGLSTRAERPGIIPTPGNVGYGPQAQFMRSKDMAFARYETFAKVGAAPITKYKDLKELVQVNIQYETLAFQAREDYFRLNEAQVLVPITIQVENKDLTFKAEGDQKVARLGIFGLISSMTGQVVTEFEDDVVTRYSDQTLQQGLLKSSVYQKIVPLDGKYRYRVDLVVKDLNSGHVGVLRQAIIPPPYKAEGLQGSSLILSDQIEPLDTVPQQDEMFVLGDVRILPRLNARFTPGMPLGVYLQLYNARLDQTTLAPSLKVTFNLLKDGQLLKSAIDESGESTQFFSERRVVLMKHLLLGDLEPGDYQIEVEILDRLSDQTLKQVGAFSVVKG